jgi:flagellar FliL protein
MSDKAAETEKPAAEGEAAAPKAPNPLIPVIAVVVLMPAVTFAMINFLLLPKIRGIVLEKKATEHAEGAAGADAHGAKPAAAHGEKKKEEKGGHGAKKEEKGGHGKEAKGGGGGGAGGAFSYDFENIVVNLSGTMGTRYLKSSFTVLSDNPEVKTIIEENKKQLLDVATTVLSTRTLADLEQPGAKNVIRNDLMANLNQALKSDLISQIYFSDFVVQ